ENEHAEHGRGVGEGHDVAQEGHVPRAQRIENAEQRAHTGEVEEPADGCEDGHKRLARAPPRGRLLEAKPDVVVPGGIAEEGRLRVMAKEVELEGEAEGEKGRNGQQRRDAAGPGPGKERGRGVRAPFFVPSDLVLRRGYLP